MKSNLESKPLLDKDILPIILSADAGTSLQDFVRHVKSEDCELKKNAATSVSNVNLIQSDIG